MKEKPRANKRVRMNPFAVSSSFFTFSVNSNGSTVNLIYESWPFFDFKIESWMRFGPIYAPTAPVVL